MKKIFLLFPVFIVAFTFPSIGVLKSNILLEENIYKQNVLQNIYLQKEILEIPVLAFYQYKTAFYLQKYGNFEFFSIKFKNILFENILLNDKIFLRDKQ